MHSRSLAEKSFQIENFVELMASNGINLSDISWLHNWIFFTEDIRPRPHLSSNLREAKQVCCAGFVEGSGSSDSNISVGANAEAWAAAMYTTAGAKHDQACLSDKQPDFTQSLFLLGMKCSKERKHPLPLE